MILRTMQHVVLIAIWLLSANLSAAHIYNVKELNSEQIKALDPESTVVILPGGILEQHGPYLPSFTDGYVNEQLTSDLAAAITERGERDVLIFPTIPLGTGGANDIGRKYSFPGTYTVRATTLRGIFMDLATELGDQRFMWIFIMHAHGSPIHNIALDQAGEYFHDTYGGHMVNLFGMVRPDLSEIGKELITEEQREEDGLLMIHADMRETSQILHLRPDLIDSAYKQAPAYPVNTRKDLAKIARAENWPGYFGSPRLATEDFGARYWDEFSSTVVGLALRILDGLDYSKLPRLEGNPVTEAALRYQKTIRDKQQAWLVSKAYDTP